MFLFKCSKDCLIFTLADEKEATISINLSNESKTKKKFKKSKSSSNLFNTNYQNRSEQSKTCQNRSDQDQTSNFESQPN